MKEADELATSSDISIVSQPASKDTECLLYIGVMVIYPTERKKVFQFPLP